MINFNGSILESEITVFGAANRAFKYGDALFETVKVINSKVIFLEDHYFRLMASMRMLRIEIPMNFTMEFFEKEIINTTVANNLDSARVRFTVYRSDGGTYAPVINTCSYLIESSPLNVEVKETYTLDVFKDYFLYSGLLSTIKTTNKITNVLASIFAKENNLDNCVLLNEKKFVVEAINGNIFTVKGTVIKTPPIEEGCVKGIMRKKLIEILSKTSEFTLKEEAISPFELQKADEVFITNAIVGIQPVTNYKKATFKTTVAERLILELKKLI
ncbi:aminotransferase class IV [Lutibacter sp. A80]|uniref:aminotransferase class IV n=1 Tax=Lutibacter sp. A80 TaxID=2918453 RepID=UPI001F061245|nr:aminotransferase class IV [Lutibacter sp. A80]UMB60857.1 aminotransferase class IV [Lutibacter sp. A80]